MIKQKVNKTGGSPLVSLDPGLVEGVRDPQESSGPVTGVVVSRAGSSVGHPPAELLGALHHAVRSPAVNVDDEPDTTGVLLQAGVVQTLSWGVAPTSPVIRHPAYNLCSLSLYILNVL